MTGTYGPKHKLFTPCATRTIIFQIESNLIVWFTQCASFFFFSTRFFFFCQNVCRALFVEILCNKTSQQVTIKGPNDHQKQKSFFEAVTFIATSAPARTL